MKNLFICDYIFVSCSTLNTYMSIPCRVHWKHPSWWRSGSSRSRDRTHPGALWIQTWVMIQDKLYFSPWWPLLWLLTWYPIFKSSHCNSFEERAPVPRTHFQMNYYAQWLDYMQGTRATFQYPIRRLIVRSREVLKPRDLYLELSDRSEISQADRQDYCRRAYQMSKRWTITTN